MSDLKSSQKRVSLSSEFVGEFFSAIKNFLYSWSWICFPMYMLKSEKANMFPAYSTLITSSVLNGLIMHSILDVQFCLF
jgi:hypothetical protein